ncbi:free fatty acid receptor 2-like [Misgurnus anguillicaudatus]|uniref:free fatty acid receptor 2-like n=1 Tax=Misgurnus anguillicaudatus TaxID=75329 RepID=UPI003CCFA0C2
MTWTVALSNLVLAVYGFTFITGLPANLLAFYAFCRKIHKKSTPMDVLLLSLTISDLIFLFILPFRMIDAANTEWMLPYDFCLWTGFISYSTIYNSTVHLTAISVERYLGVAFPIKYKLKRNPRNAAIAVIFIWLISFAHYSIVYSMQYHNRSSPNITDPSERRDTCYKEFSQKEARIPVPLRLEIFGVLLCAPFLICCFCYIKFIHILYNLPDMNAKIRKRAIGMAVATLFVFIICLMPFSISNVVGYGDSNGTEWRLYALVTCTLNACLDPFIFYFSSSAFRETFKSVLRELIRRMAMLGCHSASTVSCLKMGQQRREQRDHIPMV